MTSIRTAAVYTFKPNPSALLKRIRGIAAVSERVFFGNHATERMEERGITNLDVLRVLRLGEIKGEIEPGKNEGEWKCKIVAQKRGSRQIGVVTLTSQAQRLFIKTVEWEDL